MQFMRLALCLFVLTLPNVVPAANVSCGDTLDGVSVVLDGNVGPCAGTAVTLNNGASLDLGGYGIGCDGSMFTIGVDVKNGSKLRNGNVYDCEFSGVQVSGTSGSTVEGVYSVNNGTGFNVFAAGTSSLKSNVASTNANQGFYVTSGANRLTSNTAFNNSVHGFWVTAAGSSLSGNLSNDNGSDGFLIAATAKLKSNSATYNGGSGFNLAGSEIKVKGCSAARNFNGFSIGGNENSVAKSNASTNFQSGVYVAGDGNAVSGNILMANTFGLVTDGTADENSLKSNRAIGSFFEDLYTVVPGCGTNVWTGNVGLSNDACIP